MHPELSLSRDKAAGILTHQLLSVIGKGLFQLPDTSSLVLCTGQKTPLARKGYKGERLQVLAELLVCQGTVGTKDT